MSTLNVLEFADLQRHLWYLLVQVQNTMVYGVVLMLGQNGVENNYVNYTTRFMIYLWSLVDFIMCMVHTKF